MEPVLFSWSGGKDSSLALYEIFQRGEYKVVALLTTLGEVGRRVSHHGVREELLDEQAKSIGLPLEKMYLPENPSNAVYESQMREVLSRYKDLGVNSVVFGDIFLEDLRKYREDKLAQIDMKGVFPLWKQDTAALVRRFIDLGFKARLVCIDPNKLSPDFAGASIDDKLLADLPSDVDPCGENGEYHSFVYEGPIFKYSIAHEVAQVERHGNNYFCEVLPKGVHDGSTSSP